MGISEKRSRPQLKIWREDKDAFEDTEGSRSSQSQCEECDQELAQWGSRAAGKMGWETRGGMASANLTEVTVAVDVLALVPVLQLVVFDVEPQGLHDGSPRLCVHSQQPRESGVQLVLGRLEMDRRESEEGFL